VIGSSIKDAAMKRMVLALAALASAALIDAQPGQAYEGPWCAYMTAGRDYYTYRCDLPNYEACRAEIAATPGTWCTQNPHFPGYYAKPGKVKKKRAR
jgi:hypothetical protein